MHLLFQRFKWFVFGCKPCILVLKSFNRLCLYFTTLPQSIAVFLKLTILVLQEISSLTQIMKLLTYWFYASVYWSYCQVWIARLLNDDTLLLTRSGCSLSEKLFENSVKSEALIHICPAFFFKLPILGYFGLFMDILDFIILFDNVFESFVKFSFKINNKLRLFNC